MKKNLLSLAFIMFLGSISFGQADKSYRKTLNKMFEVSGTEATYQTAIKEMITIYKQRNTGVNPKIWDEMEVEFLKTSLSDLVDMLAPVYYKYLTKDELKDVIEFYKTPTGSKFAKNTPLIMQESMQVGKEWGEKLAISFEARMKEKGY